MRRLILTTLALTFLAAPAAYAGNFPLSARPAAQELNTVTPKADNVRFVRRGYARPVWRIGRPLPVWQRIVIRDYYRFGLRKPGPGMQWVRAGNDFLLVRTGSGVIVAVR